MVAKDVSQSTARENNLSIFFFSAESHHEKMARRTSSDAQSSNVQIQKCSSSSLQLNKKIIRRDRRPVANITSPKPCTIIHQIEAAEKISGCVIDFQI